MIYLSLFLEFLKIGLFTFGGAYGAIPLIRETVLSAGWMSDEMFSNIIAISESTPGPIMVNAATYIGNMQGGIVGAILATSGVVLPSFAVIIIIFIFLKKYITHHAVKAVLSGVKPCIAGIILATGAYMAVSALTSSDGSNIMSAVILAILAAVSGAFKLTKKRQISPISLICISAVLGIILC